MRTATVLLLMALAGCGKSDPPAPAAAAAPSAPVETVPNPVYASWAKFKPGTRVVVRSSTSTEGQPGQTSTTTTTTLVEVAADHVVIETQTKSRRYDGYEEDNPASAHKLPKELPLPPGMTREQSRKRAAETGEEQLAVGGKEYRTTWEKGKDRNEAGEVQTQTWSSDEVPGRFVKAVSRTPAVGKLTVLELIEVRVTP